ncbi:MAG: methylenetetrahydrofolate--tRNA-(uracil(54)-C(5))-methyltransferase (FADH(2)-oxidizing) TrmFO [Bacilli bacterium]|nr:methylenetetrahydrofolate--tRNA-(uracil(54)-C(5))-methyltransferase (FADH(2)-oxidizing) TrmFO [Bacilli bacterium]
MENKEIVTVIGAGLAGSEASYQLAKRGFKVKLYEMRPKKMTPAHQTGLFSELVCSNSLRASSLENAVGVLKEEMRLLDSLIMKAADATRVEAGGALAVDREKFASYITETLRNHPNIEIVNEEVTRFPKEYVIIATGPLTSDALSKEISLMLGEEDLFFFDATAPIVTAESIDRAIVFEASRYNKGEAAYLNAPMSEEEFTRFYEFLLSASTVETKDFEIKVFEACMPIEEMAKRGKDTLLFGPMKPVGLIDPKTGKRAFAVVQLRKDNAIGSLYNIVGFQTHLKFPDQKKLISLIPGLEKAEIVRYGVMHLNTYINSPKLLNPGFQYKNNHKVFFAGQMTGVEGYVESASSGLVAGINMARMLEGRPFMSLSSNCAIGSLSLYVTTSAIKKFEPMNVNFGLFSPLNEKMPKKFRKIAYGQRALETLKEIIDKEKI